MKYIFGEFYLKKVFLLLSHRERLPFFTKLVEELWEKKIVCEAMLTEEAYPVEEETLYLTDCEAVLKKLCVQMLPVAVYLHEDNRRENLSAARYAFEAPETLDATYIERVYRRQKGIPWDILETQRCYLRETMQEDVDAFYHIYKEPEITRYTDALYESKISERAYIREYTEKIYHYFEFGIWTVVWKETGEVIGRAGLNVREGYDLPELGYVIGVPWQGKGVAYEVCKAILEYAKAEFGFDRVMTLIQKENLASVRLAEKLGFEEQERLMMHDREFLVLMNKNF